MSKTFFFFFFFFFSIFCLLHAEDEDDLKETLDSILMESIVFSGEYQKDEIPALDYKEQKQWKGLCQIGKNQSPINILTKNVTKTEKEDNIEISYDNVRIAEIKNIGTTLMLFPKGYGFIMRDDMQYILQYLIVHVPSEHAINNTRALLELQAVHKSPSGEYLIVSVLFYEGDANKSLLQVLLSIPENTGETKTFKEKLNVDDFFPDLEKGYYSYSGSLTFPPCTEKATWLIMKDFKSLYKARLEVWFRKFKPNFRDVQKLGNRKVYEY